MNRPSSPSWLSGVGWFGTASWTFGRERLEQRAPAPAGHSDDLVVRTLLADVLVGRNGRKDRDADRLREGRGLPGAVVLVDDDAAHADIATELAEIFHRRADIVGDVEGLEIVRSDDDDLLAHVAGDRQAEAAAHHVAEEVEQDVVEAPLVEAELLEQLEAMDDAASAAAAADFRPAQFHGEDAVALEADVADGDVLAGQLLLRRGLDDGRAARPPKSSEVVSLLGSQPISSTFLPCCAIM